MVMGSILGLGQASSHIYYELWNCAQWQQVYLKYGIYNIIGKKWVFNICTFAQRFRNK